MTDTATHDELEEMMAVLCPLYMAIVQLREARQKLEKSIEEGE